MGAPPDPSGSTWRSLVHRVEGISAGAPARVSALVAARPTSLTWLRGADLFPGAVGLDHDAAALAGVQEPAPLFQRVELRLADGRPDCSRSHDRI